jgi:hypothetical protein
LKSYQIQNCQNIIKKDIRNSTLSSFNPEESFDKAVQGQVYGLKIERQPETMQDVIGE